MGFAAPGRSTSRVFDMLGGNEFRLRQGFACGKTLVTRHLARPSISRNPAKVSLAHIPFLAVCGSACVYKARETSGRMPLFC